MENASVWRPGNTPRDRQKKNVARQLNGMRTHEGRPTYGRMRADRREQSKNRQSKRERKEMGRGAFYRAHHKNSSGRPTNESSRKRLNSDGQFGLFIEWTYETSSLFEVGGDWQEGA